MGLTHYWKRKPGFTPGSFAVAAAGCRLVLGRMNIALASPDGTGDAVIDNNAIRFNGVAPSACEPFDVSQLQVGRVHDGMIGCFCKTDRLPYDLCVKLSLIILQHHLDSDIHVASDEDNDAWISARSICAEHLGYGEDFRLSAP